MSREHSSLLNIVDLAGSERRQTTATQMPVSPIKSKVNINPSKQKQTEEESVSINQSLTTLGRIFAILSNKKAKEKQLIPYRESKVTRILQDSLTHESKTVMIVNVCSEIQSARQTKETLTFAQNAMINL